MSPLFSFLRQVVKAFSAEAVAAGGGSWGESDGEGGRDEPDPVLLPGIGKVGVRPWGCSHALGTQVALSSYKQVMVSPACAGGAMGVTERERVPSLPHLKVSP